MNILNTILYTNLGSNFNNIVFLCFRFLFAFELFRVHGLKKFQHGVNQEKEHVPNPFHLPEKLNGFIASFSDTVVPVLLVFGILTRLVILPTIGVTAIGYLIVHKKDTPEGKDIPYIYTLIGLLILCLGAGTFSFDSYLLTFLN